MLIRPASRESVLSADPLREFFVFWDDITDDHVRTFEAALEKSETEQEMQRYLEEHPLMLVQHLGGGHGRWVIPQKRLGSEFITDFTVGEKSSIGFEWYAVELESPRAQIFRKNGDPSSTLVHAIRQVLDWRAWLKNNQNYASRGREEHGLGLSQISNRVPGLIVIGRDKGLDPSNADRRRQWSEDLNIKIHTYDWMVRNALGRANALSSMRRSRLDHVNEPHT